MQQRRIINSTYMGPKNGEKSSLRARDKKANLLGLDEGQQKSSK